MIVKDEEKILKGFLRAIKGLVDEIIIIDTGSLDKTKEIALSYPQIQWYEFPFDNHFANQKNRCLEKASCDWILFKDADEIFEQDLLDNLQRLTLYEPYIQYDAFAFARKTFIDGCLNNLADHDYQVRFWKNHKGIHYEGHIHEGVTGFENMLKLNVWIIHQKTSQMQQEDNERYWGMGQAPPAGWENITGKWVYDSTKDPASPDYKELASETNNDPT